MKVVYKKHNRLKIGLIIDDSELIPSWYYETILAIFKNPVHELFFIKRKPAIKNKAPFLYRLYSRFENYLFKNQLDATELKSVKAVNSDINFLNPGWENEWKLTESGLNTINKFKLDLIYTIDYEDGLEENLSTLTTYGFWYIRFGDPHTVTKRPVGFKEVMNRQMITESSLLAKKQDQVYLLYESKTKTIQFSVKKNFNSIAWKSSAFIPFRLKELSVTGSKFFSRFTVRKVSEFHNIQYPDVSIPYLFVKNSLAYFIHRLKIKANKDRFSLFYANKEFQLEDFAASKFKQIALPENVFFADPFLIEKNGNRYLFFEEFDQQKNKGHISVISLDKNNEFSPIKTVLELPYHLSYPYVFESDGDYFMIPESSANKTISLYKSKNFPFEWELVMHLIENENFVDATIHYENQMWWLFACSNDPLYSTNDLLFIYYSDTLFSNNWKPHLQNPVITTIENCRPAGRIFRHNNKLYRPAQNNAHIQYGYGLKINEIIVLNENEYVEKEILAIDPHQLGLKACHHIDYLEGLVVIDGIK